jgi:hypothetical protein
MKTNTVEIFIKRVFVTKGNFTISFEFVAVATDACSEIFFVMVIDRSLRFEFRIDQRQSVLS